MRLAQPRLDHPRLTEVEGRAGHRRDRGRNQRFVHLAIAAAEDLQLVPQHRPATRQVEVVVMRQVDHRRRIGRGFVLDGPAHLVIEPVPHHRPQPAREALVARRAVELQSQAAVALGLRPPQQVAESARAAVQAVAAVVGHQRVAFAVQPERGARDAVAIPADDHAEMRIAQHVVLERRQAQHDVGRFAPRIRHLQPRDDAPMGDRRQPQAAPVVHRELMHRPAVGQVAVDPLLNRCHRVLNR